MLSFHPLYMDLCRTKVHSFDNVQFIDISFMDPILVSGLKTLCFALRLWRFCAMFLSRTFIVLCFICMSVIHFESVGKRYV